RVLRVTSELSTLASHALAPAVKLAAWVGKGRQITAKGVPRPADLPAVAAVLGVKSPGKVRSAADVASIHWPWVAAEAAGLIDLGVTSAVARSVDGDDGDPARLWLTGLDAVLRAESHDRNRRGALTLCRAVLAVLAAGWPPDKVEPAVRDVLDEYEPVDAAAVSQAFRQTGAVPVDSAVALLTAFGAVEDVRLTPLGEWAHERFEERAPEAVTPALRAGVLLTRLAPLPVDEAWRQALRWFGDRRPVDRAARLLHAAEFAAPVERVAAVDVVAGFGDAVLPAWRNALRQRNLRPHALAALADWGQGPGVDEAQRRWLVTEYALSARAKGGIEDAYHYVRDSGGLGVVAGGDHPGAGELHEALARFAASARIRVHQLKITRSPSWRRVLVPAGVTLGALHEIVHAVFDWASVETDPDVHAFDADGVRYADPFHGLADHRDEHEIRLSSVLPRPGTSLRYLHGARECGIACERIVDPDSTVRYPVCVAGHDYDEDELNRRLAGLGITQP
ncbi:MAG TPA: plasmid pRiA4b ORF-3 family protein, partial [Amycolatopsis sp.]|nr:plasmid pRiA4b ORF-3 family protein [Amycolatopsis sp.]